MKLDTTTYEYRLAQERIRDHLRYAEQERLAKVAVKKNRSFGKAVKLLVSIIR